MKLLLDWWMWLEKDTRETVATAVGMLAAFAAFPFAVIFLFWAAVSFVHWLPWPEVGK